MTMSNNDYAYGSIPSTNADDPQQQEDHYENITARGTRSPFGIVAMSIAMGLALCGGFTILSSLESNHGVLRSSSIIHSLHNPNAKKEGSEDVSSYLLDPSLDSTPLFYDEQFVDHIQVDTEHHSSQLQTWSHRFYKKSQHWKGPGYPILVVLGGEDALDLPLLWPLVNDAMAREFG
eukprot:CAMPEP_0172468632 /NCGR_PEP_ID=MMETSP1065-20121228/61722_1 /TAXON_ID=265537 /ORGANISM="Amphiprora paludosa, Strain CCMP125" /LENGTH=176 /DNA_ID=CAMNT_0013226057 /DNA_START=40 /DNA_END=566 /DNA_ORIENTATION=-